MENKIQELTDKIYKEGVDKANAEAQQLLIKAPEEASSIVEKAKIEAVSIIDNAKKESDELMQNTKSELKLFSALAVSALKTEITNLLSNESVSTSVKNLTQDANFLNEFILKMAQEWAKEQNIVISTKDADSLTAFFATHAKQILDKGVEIKQVNNIDTLFSISPADGSYKINFGDDEFISYFKAFLRPKLITLLFGSNQ